MDLHPCECDTEEDFEPEHWLEEHQGQLVAVYEGQCPGCGKKRRFDFALDPEIPPPPPAYGGDKPSTIIDPGQFLFVSDQLAMAVPGLPDDVPADERASAAEILSISIAALEEVLKFLPSGVEAVPEQAFTTPEGRAVYEREPGRFRRIRLEAVLDVYHEMIQGYERHLADGDGQVGSS